MNDKFNPMAPAEFAAWRDAYFIAWVGASNPRGVKRSLDEHSQVFGEDHPAVRCIAGHLAFLEGKGLGPEVKDLDLLIKTARSLRIVI